MKTLLQQGFFDILSVINNNKRKNISFFDKFIKILFWFSYPKSTEEKKIMASQPMAKTTKLVFWSNQLKLSNQDCESKLKI